MIYIKYTNYKKYIKNTNYKKYIKFYILYIKCSNMNTLYS